MPSARYRRGFTVLPDCPTWRALGIQPASTIGRDTLNVAPSRRASSSKRGMLSFSATPRPIDSRKSALVMSTSPARASRYSTCSVSPLAPSGVRRDRTRAPSTPFPPCRTHRRGECAGPEHQQRRRPVGELALVEQLVAVGAAPRTQTAVPLERDHVGREAEAGAGRDGRREPHRVDRVARPARAPAATSISALKAPARRRAPRSWGERSGVDRSAPHRRRRSRALRRGRRRRRRSAPPRAVRRRRP